MIQIGLLENHDVIEESDWYRQTNLSYGGIYGDQLYFNSTYGGAPENRLKWLPAKYGCYQWVGLTVGEVKARMQKFHGVEFIRGPLPRYHQEHLTAKEIANAQEKIRLINRTRKDDK